MTFNELIQQISFETFSDVINLSPRKVRESLYSHYGIKTKSRSFFSSLKDKKETRLKNLQGILSKAKNPKEQEFIKELFRNWLFRQRPLLKSSLDFLGVENDNGLVEVETDFFKELPKEKVAALLNHVRGQFSDDAILIYFTFMEVPYLNELMKN